MEQHLYEPVHEEIRTLCRQFIAREALPYHDEWSKAGIVDRAVWRKAGAAGLLGMDVPEEYGGGGQRDFRYNAVLVEEIITAGVTGLGFGLHNDVIAPYLTELTTDDQRKRWLPRFCAGEIRSEEHTSELQSRPHLVCRLLLEKKKNIIRLPFLQTIMKTKNKTKKYNELI